MSIRKAIIPAGGLGTRLAPLTQLMPKEMLPVGGKVVLQHVLEECDAAGLDRVLVVLNRRKTALFGIAEAAPSPRDPLTGVPARSVYFANQEEQGGLAHAVLHGEAFAGDEPFVVALGDAIIHGGEESLLRRMIAAHLRHGAAATVAAQEVPPDRLSRYGILDPVGGPDSASGAPFRIRGIVEKPDPSQAPSRLAIAGRYVFSPVIFRACREAPRNAAGELELTEAMSWLARQGEVVLGVPLAPDERRLDIGNPQSYAEAFRLLAES